MAQSEGIEKIWKKNLHCPKGGKGGEKQNKDVQISIWEFLKPRGVFQFLQNAWIVNDSQTKGGILSGSAAAPLTEVFRNWTEILVENHEFLSHFGLE